MSLESVFNTPGVGSAVWLIVIVGLTIFYGNIVLWIVKGHEDETKGD
ncbi:MAG: hypothetical protein ACYS47_03170 [Planctomycetota bacterium]|jgi:hypothetical protein